MTTAPSLGVRLLVCLLLLSSVATGNEQAKWIWNPVHRAGQVPPGACYFRGSFSLPTVRAADLEVAADDAFEVYLNGKKLGRGSGWQHFTRYNLSKHLRQGRNVVAIKVINRGRGDAGLVARVTSRVNGEVLLVTNGSWRTYATTIPKWHWLRFADRGWKSAVELGPWGGTEPWTEESLPAAEAISTAPAEPRLLPADTLTDSPDGSRVVPAGANEPISAHETPLLLRPLTAIGLSKKKTRRTPSQRTQARLPREQSPPSTRGGATARTPANSRPASGPQAISNPYVRQGPPKAARRGARPDKAGSNTNTPGSRKIGAQQRFTPQEGFAVEMVLGHARTGSLIATTFNEFGQVVAARENGPLLLIVDTNRDGKLDQVKTYCPHVKNCHGILALSGMVFVVGEGPQGVGLYRLQDNNRDGELEEVTSLATFQVDNAEHGPHGLVLGPDGNIYLVVGNHARLQGKFSRLSPRRHLYEGDLIPRYEDPGGHANGVRLPAGCVLRTDIHGKKLELFASGLRNAYDLAFNETGELFTFDSDMESDMGTTWYRPTRFYHVLPGSEFGWRSGWAKWPSYYHDSVPPVAEVGRGSPTGLVFYEHDTYPEKYRHAAFLADWSEGRILTAHLSAVGASYTAETEVFLAGKPLNVTDLEVGPDGLLYFVTGGRGTAGGIYRVTWKGSSPPQRSLQDIDDVVQAPQIHSSWSRQHMAAVRLRLDQTWDREIAAVAEDPSQLPADRVQALQLMQWMGPIPSEDLLLALSEDTQGAVRRQAAYLLSASADDERVALRLLELLEDADAAVRRQAAESLVRANRSVPYEFVAPMLASADRFEAWSARRLLALDHPDEWQQDAFASEQLRVFIQSATALMTAWPSEGRALQVVKNTVERMQGYVSDDDFLDLLRVLQLAVVRGQLAAEDVADLTPVLAEEFPANHQLMNRELIRLLVRLQATDIKDRFLEYLDSELSVADTIHVATHLRFLEVEWTTEEKLRLLKHLRSSATAGNSVAGYLQNIALELGETLSVAESASVLKDAEKNPSALLAAVMKLPHELTPDQIGSLAELDRALTASDAMTKRLKVAVLAVLARDGKEESMAYLREVFDRDPTRRLEVAVGLAEQPAGKNWSYLVRSLPALEGGLAEEILEKLTAVEQSPHNAEAYDHVISLGLKLGAQGGDKAVRLLEHWQGYAATEATPRWDKALAIWQQWLATTYPDYSPKNSETAALPAWEYADLLKYVEGDVLAVASVMRGREIFHQAQCANCHRHGSEGEAMGPDLTGLSKRFRTEEILESIVHPSRVISDQYRAKTLLTDEGKSFTGIVGSGGENELLVLQPSGEKVRVKADAVVETVPSPISAMPEALLQSYSPEQIADLVAFLQSNGELIAETPDDTKR